MLPTGSLRHAVASLLVLGCVCACCCVGVGAGEGCGAPGCAKADHAGCTKAASDDTAVAADLSEDEQKLTSYLADQIETHGSFRFDGERVVRESGVSLEDVRLSVIEGAVVAELERRGFDLSAILGGGGYCSKFSACSVDRNLNNASGDELLRYQREKAEDGAVYNDRIAPDFTLPTTAGTTVSLSDYRGRNVALVFLSGHCVHSLDTLPILGELKKKYAADVEILPVFVNSGDAETVRSRAWELDIEWPLLVSESKDVSRAYDTRMVPSTFLIDEQGRIRRKFVGYKQGQVLDEALAELVRS